MSYVRFSQFTPITSISGLSVVGLQGGKNVRIDAASFLSGYLKPTNAGTRGQVLTKTSSGSQWSSKTLQQLASAAGATYNSSDGTFTLNGISLNEQQMANTITSGVLYASSNLNYRFRFNSKIITNIAVGQILSDPNVSARNLFDQCNNIIVAKLPQLENYNGVVYSDTYRMFSTCKKLTTIIGIINMSRITSTTLMFSICESLETVYLYGLKASISFSDSPNLSEESILYMIENSAATSPITITLHPTAYAMAVLSFEIHQALGQKQNVSLAQTEEL